MPGFVSSDARGADQPSVLSTVSRFVVAALVSLVAVLAWMPDAALASVATGERIDATFDQGAAGRDLIALRAEHDSAGVIEATLTLRGAPTADADGFVSVIIGTTTADGRCVAPFVLLAGYLDPADTQVVWALSENESPQTTASKVTVGTTITLRGNGAGLARPSYTCATASIKARGASSVLFDELDAPLALVSPATTPTPTPVAPLPSTASPSPFPASPPPSQPSPTATPAPASTPTSPPKAIPTPKAKPQVSLVVVEDPEPVVRNRWRKVRLGVANGTKRTTPALLVSAKAPAGVRASSSLLRVAPLRPGKTTTVTLKLRAAAKAATVSRIRFSLLDGRRVLARTATQLRTAQAPVTGPTSPTGPTGTPRPQVPSAPPTPAANPNDLAGRFYGRFTHELRATAGGFDYVAVTDGLVFVDAQFVSTGLPAGGLPTCTARSATCLPYTFDASTGALTIDGKPAEFSADADRSRLLVGGKAYFRHVIPAPGTRFTVALKNITSSLFPYNAVTSKFLRMSADGRFSFSAATAISPGGDGDAVGIAGPDDQRGTYEVLDRARIRLTFASGKVLEHTISLFGPDPAKDGILLDSAKYWVP